MIRVTPHALVFFLYLKCKFLHWWFFPCTFNGRFHIPFLPFQHFSQPIWGWLKSVDPFTSRTISGCLLDTCCKFLWRNMWTYVTKFFKANFCFRKKTEIDILDSTLLQTQIKNKAFSCGTEHIMQITLHNRSESCTQPVIFSFPKKI